QPVPIAPGDRLVLRDPGRKRTVAGAEVLDVDPSGRAKDAATRLARPLGERLLASHSWLPVADLGRLAGCSEPDPATVAGDLVARGTAVEIGGWLVAPETVAELRGAAEARVREHHDRDPLDPGVELAALAAALRVTAEQLRAVLMGAPALTVERGMVRDAS